MSRMMYNAHTWVGVTDDHLATWQQKLRKPLGLLTKPMLRGIAPVKVDTVDLFALAQILPPTDQLHVARLRYLKRLLMYCPQILWNLLFQACDWPHSWLAHCRTSFAWYLQFYQVPGAPTDTTDLTAWITHVALDTNWNGRLKKAAKGCLCFRQATAEEHVWLKAFQARFVDAGGVLPCAQVTQSETWVCDQCQKALPVQASPCDPLRPGAWVPSPGQVLCHRPNVQRVCKDICHTETAHRASPRCHGVPANLAGPVSHRCRTSKWWLMILLTMKPPSHYGRRAGGAAKALAPARKIFGPCLPPAGSQDAAHMHRKWSQRNPAAGSGFEQLQGHALARDEAPEPRVVLFSDDLPAFVYQSAAGMNQGDGRFSLHGLAKETARLHIRTQVFVHFFSGYRRRGDLHDLLEHHIFPNGHQLFVLSVDMCLQRERGDLASSSSLTWWMDRIKTGQVCGSRGGPPASPTQPPDSCRVAPPGGDPAVGQTGSPTFR